MSIADKSEVTPVTHDRSRLAMEGHEWQLHAVHAAGGWRRARDYPVFSREWLRRRVLTFLAAACVLGVPVLLSALSETDDWRAVVIVTVILPLPLITYPMFGPSLATWVHSRGLNRRTETIALIAAVVVGMCGAWVFDKGVDVGLRAALYGDAHAKPGLETWAGVFVHRRSTDSSRSSGDAPSASEVSQHMQSQFGELVSVANYGTILLLMFWFGGGFELIRFFRERREIEEAARQAALARAVAARNDAELKLSILAAQIEPHFLFNTLAGVRSAVTSDPQRAVAIVDHLADYLRASIPRLRADGTAGNSTVASQLDIVRAYLNLMHARIPRLEFSIECDGDLVGAAMPPLILISLVENAVKHGIEPKIGRGCVTVRISREQNDDQDMLIAAVEDDGVGFGGTTSGNGIGLINIRERLATMYEGAASLSLTERASGGVIACIHLPFSNAMETS